MLFRRIAVYEVRDGFFFGVVFIRERSWEVVVFLVRRFSFMLGFLWEGGRKGFRDKENIFFVYGVFIL